MSAEGEVLVYITPETAQVIVNLITIADDVGATTLTEWTLLKQIHQAFEGQLNVPPWILRKMRIFVR